MNAILTPSVFAPLPVAESRPYGIPLPSDRSSNLREREVVRVAVNRECLQHHEESIARVTETAYHAVLELGYGGSFLELELSPWKAIRQAVEQGAVELVSHEVA